jgi:hypothetical protein
VPDVWCSIYVGGAAVLFESSSIWDVTNVVGGDGPTHKPIGSCVSVILMLECLGPVVHFAMLHYGSMASPSLINASCRVACIRISCSVPAHNRDETFTQINNARGLRGDL